MASKLSYSTAAALGLVVAAGLAWWIQSPQRSNAPGTATPSAAASTAPRAPAVDVARVEVVRLVDDAQTVGSLRSRQGVMLRPEVSGRVRQINFRDGQRVHKGQLLVQLDDQLPLAQVQQSRAELSIAMANHQRNQDLVAQNFISQRSVEESAAALEVAQAKLALAQATAARLRILAPFDGIAGIRSINVGDYLKDGTDMVNIEDIDALYVDFRLPERFGGKVHPGQSARVDFDALPGARYEALIQAIDPLIETNGRSVGVRACIDNRQMQLRPGMFARVSTVFGERARARVIPEEALVPLGGKVYVIRLKPGPTAQSGISERVEVSLGVRRPGNVEILAGLDEGDTVVTAGQQRIQRDGTEVRLTASAQPAGAAAPAPVPARQASAPAPTLTGARKGVARAVGNPCALRGS